PRQRDIDPRIRTMQSQSNHLVFVYAAGPCGDWLSRSVTHTGHPCWVVAPSRIPKTPGERGKNHRRDALTLARLRRSGDLTPVYVPGLTMPPSGSGPLTPLSRRVWLLQVFFWPMVVELSSPRVFDSEWSSSPANAEGFTTLSRRAVPAGRVCRPRIAEHTSLLHFVTLDITWQNSACISYMPSSYGRFSRLASVVPPCLRLVCLLLYKA